MSVTLYTLPSSSSSRKAKKFLEDNNISFTVQNMYQEPLSREQLYEILAHTENGVDDIISERSKEYEILKEQGIVFDELSLTGLYKLIRERPKLLKAPIMVKNKLTLVGYNIEEIHMLLNREDKKREFQNVLSRIRAMEDKEFVEQGIIRIAKHDMSAGAYERAI